MDISTENRLNDMPNHIEEGDILSLLQWYMDSGVDETIDDLPQDWFELSRSLTQKTTPKSPSPTGQSGIIPKKIAPLASKMVSIEHIVQDAARLAASCNSLSELNDVIKSFNGCSLKNIATNTVFSDGNPDSDIMVIGEAPGVDEDRYGKAIIGKNGQMLDRMFKAIGLSRENDFYLTNILPWRPPGNRKALAEEITICLPFIRRHIELFNPKTLILLGGISANSLINSDLGITRLRGKWLEYDLCGKTIPVRPLFHPAYLLKQPKAKADTWKDLLEIKAKIGEETNKKSGKKSGKKTE
ncbi:MAG: uracil-DNA glycosylase [Emcibacter sp.]|nr:uracil-DNA glycosylase [Emcibacter sp.]